MRYVVHSIYYYETLSIEPNVKENVEEKKTI